MRAGLPLGRVAHAMDGAARVAEQRPRLLFSLAAVIGLVFYLIAVPYQNWIGLFPRGDHVEMIAGWPRAAAGAQTQLLNGVQANFTRIWRSHANSPPPPALYAAPALTPEQKARYRHLRRPPTPAKAIARKQASSAKYMFVAALKDVGDQLPDLVNALAVVTAFLGPDRVSFSIIEGPSWDPTPHVLKDVVRPMLNSLGVHDSSINFEVNLPSISWDKVNRIEALAELRNQALQPLWGHGSDPAWDVAAIVYFNDVFLHAADMLELLHQHVTSSRGLGTGITAAWDWMTRDPAHFYDVWVARTMEGDLFYPIDNPWWWPSDAILSTSPASKAKFDTLSPFQVFAAWNGMVVLNPAPFTQHGVHFRRGSKTRGECAASECGLLASDFWKTNYGRVQVVPAVQLAYDRPTAFASAARLREEMVRLGWENGVPPATFDKAVSFAKTPPKKVRCNPWPEAPGLGHNVWGITKWLPPYV